MAGFNVIRLLQPLRRCPVGMNFRPFGDETIGSTEYSQRNKIVSKRGTFCRHVFDKPRPGFALCG